MFLYSIMCEYSDIGRTLSPRKKRNEPFSTDPSRYLSFSLDAKRDDYMSLSSRFLGKISENKEFF